MLMRSLQKVHKINRGEVVTVHVPILHLGNHWIDTEALRLA
jgi:hypothetical protein